MPKSTATTPPPEIPAALSFAGFFRVLSGRPQHPIGEDGRMALSDHFRELRARLIRVAVYLLVGTIVALFFYDQLLEIINRPYDKARELLGEDVNTMPVITGVGAPLLLQLKLCGVAGIVGTSPLWLFEIWGFLVPGLHAHEKRWTRIFVAIAGPMFMAGVALGYFILPKGIQVLLSFTPGYVQSLVEYGTYFSFVTRMLLVFGVAFEIPLFVVMLNLVGVVKGKALGRARPLIIIGTFVFAAVATPSTDPFSMLALAIPMVLLFFLAEVVARFVDRGRERRAAQTEHWSDDEISAI